MAFADWSGRLSTVGASANELAAISASYYADPTGVQQALDTLVDGIGNGDLLVMLDTWRTSGAPFHSGYPGGGLPFGTGAAVLSGSPADDAYAISAGTGEKLGPLVSLSGGSGPAAIIDSFDNSQEVNTGLFFQSIGGEDPFLRGTLAPNASGTDLLADPATSTAGAYTADKSGSAVNIYHLSSYVYSTGTANVTAMFAMGVGLSVWGANPAAYSYGGSTASAIGAEIDFGNFSTASTTISGTQGPLPLSTITVASTSGAASSGVLAVAGAIIAYTGTTGTTFTGCTVLNGSTATLTDGATVSYSLGGKAQGLYLVSHGASAGGAPGSQYISMDSGSIGDSCNYGLVISGSNSNSGKQPVSLSAIYLHGLYATQAISVNTGSYTNVIEADDATASGALVYLNGCTATQAISVNNGDYTNVIQVTDATASYVIDVPSGSYTAFARFSGSADYGLDFSAASISTDAVHFGDGQNIAVGSSTGTIIGTSTSQMLGFWGHAPTAQPSAPGSATGYAAGTTTATFHSDDTYTGDVGTTAYTINGIVAALKSAGLIQS
jgi:hypothetical protein